MLSLVIIFIIGSTGCSKMVDPILNTHISETTWWIIMKLDTFYVEGHKFYWLKLQRKVQIFVGSMTDFRKCSMWAPPVTLHTSSRYSSSCQTHCSMSLVTVSSAAVILCFISSMLAGRGGTKTRRVARIWKRGGSFERVRKVQRNLTRIFIILESVSHGLSEIWDGISRKALKFKRFLRSKTGGLQKKKGLHRNWVWFFGQNRKFKQFCSPKTSGLQKKMIFTEIESDFSAKIGNSNNFSAQKQVVSKKKKQGLHQNLGWIFGQNRKFKQFFSPKTSGLQKKKQGLHRNLVWFFGQNRKSKKKRSSPKLRLIFRPKSEIQTLFHTESRHLHHNFGTQFSLGGLFSIFHQKSA